ncbi:class I SAM-dependent methyltransferase [Silvimonas amylolytica]|uniref:SAM-dependent methyltransferase n=1 Tax=Silvimonas amylolytica TaxID=449663 RepID=A0ABQ2PMQ7_9NEIS|nr:class I SAM-dependent methyltransferase [Silvimonas amylolytica]GGP26496.1 SAM-dependent methyltransferase [Silvimonas amylolytica]
MAQNIYDNPEFFAGYSQIPRQTRGLDGAPEWPAIRAMLPDLKGARVLDLGCGFGWATRWLREEGAVCVLGLDLSQNMIDRARSMTTDPGITYQIADLNTLALPEGAFDLVYSALTFHYVADFGQLIGAIRNTLAPGGRLVFTIEHPIFMASERAQWIKDEAGHRVWPVSAYAEEGERRTDWFVDGVIKYHRTLATTLNTLLGAGFQIRQVNEFAPDAAQIAHQPELAIERERPMFLIVSAST